MHLAAGLLPEAVRVHRAVGVQEVVRRVVVHVDGVVPQHHLAPAEKVLVVVGVGAGDGGGAHAGPGPDEADRRVHSGADGPQVSLPGLAVLGVRVPVVGEHRVELGLGVRRLHPRAQIIDHRDVDRRQVVAPLGPVLLAAHLVQLRTRPVGLTGEVIQTQHHPGASGVQADPAGLEQLLEVRGVRSLDVLLPQVVRVDEGHAIQTPSPHVPRDRLDELSVVLAGVHPLVLTHRGVADVHAVELGRGRPPRHLRRQVLRPRAAAALERAQPVCGPVPDLDRMQHHLIADPLHHLHEALGAECDARGVIGHQEDPLQALFVGVGDDGVPLGLRRYGDLAVPRVPLDEAVACRHAECDYGTETLRHPAALHYLGGDAAEVDDAGGDGSGRELLCLGCLRGQEDSGAAGSRRAVGQLPDTGEVLGLLGRGHDGTCVVAYVGLNLWRLSVAGRRE